MCGEFNSHTPEIKKNQTDETMTIACLWQSVNNFRLDFSPLIDLARPCSTTRSVIFVWRHFFGSILKHPSKSCRIWDYLQRCEAFFYEPQALAAVSRTRVSDGG